MKLLIPTEPDDTHAIIVKLALETLNHDTTLFFTPDYPTRQKNSMFVSDAHYLWQSKNHYDAITENHFDVVWWRRARKPHVPKESIHPQDYSFVIRENTLFYESFTHNLAPQAWWINTKEAAHRANFKLLQLKVASECGMTIPTTLCSNDPQEIRSFINQHENQGVIYKPLCSSFWFESEHIKITYTARVRSNDLPSNGALQRTPGIFQKEMKKKYELRITCFGDYLVAAKLDSQAHPETEVDWRTMSEKTFQIEPYKLPTLLVKQIRTFMQRLGIVFGSFDFIVTPDNEYIFLEVNEQGQFLWIEEFNPDIKLLDTFIQFITNQSPAFEWKPKQQEHSLDRYRNQIDPILIQNKHRHIDLNQHSIYTSNKELR